MKTVIFIIALVAVAMPVSTAYGDAIACPATPSSNNCNMCISDAQATPINDQCFDCKAGYYLTYSSWGSGVCTRCYAGAGIAGGTAVVTSFLSARPAAQTATSCTSCDPSCLECLSLGPSGCTKCAPDRFATTFSPSGSTCGGICTAGTTRDPAYSTLTAVETEAVCSRCDPSCSECNGSATYGTGRCTKCAAGYYLSAKSSSADTFGTCSRCTGGYGKDADTVPITVTTIPTSDYAACRTPCTPSSKCGTCSAFRPYECISCSVGFTLDGTTKTCKSLSIYAALIRIALGISALAYVLF